MFKKAVIILGLISITCSSFSQNSLNDYKYVMVPDSFDFLSEPNQFRLNNLTKLLFEKYGFTSYMETDMLPDDAISNSCLILKADVIRVKSMFISKLKVELKNCKGVVIFTSRLGESREKKNQVAYTIALRQAFDSFEPLGYSYQENSVILAYGSASSKANVDEIEKLKEEITQLKEEKEKLREESAEIPEVPKPAVVAVGIKSNPKSVEPKKNETVQDSTAEVRKTNMLFAQPITNGYQLVDGTPKVIYKIKKTGMFNVFLVEGKQAIIYQLDANWIIEYYEQEQLKTQLLNIKF